MKQNMRRARRVVMTFVSGCTLVTATACDVELTRELVTLSGGCIGDVATVAATHYFADLVGVELDSDVHQHAEEVLDEHSHDAGPLHNHEH